MGIEPRMPECALPQRPGAPPGTGCNHTTQPEPTTTMRDPKAKPKQEPGPRAPARVVGLDLHPDTFSAAVVEGDRPLGARLVSSRHAVPVPDLEAWAREELRPGDLVVCEAGSNSFEVMSRLGALGHAALCLESRRVGQVKEGGFNDDRSSAEKIARVYLGGLCKVVWEPDARTRAYRELLGAHAGAVRDAVRAGNSLRGYLNEHGVRLPRGVRPSSPRAEPAALAARRWGALEGEVLADLFAEVRHHEGRRRRLRARMCGVVGGDARMLRLMKILGINVVNAFAIVAAVGEVGRFASPKKLCAYLGVAGRREVSGTSVDRKGGCRGAGRKDVRALLVQAAQAVLNSRRGGALREWGWRVFARRGQRNIAVVAVARKLVVAAWYELKGRTPRALDEAGVVRRKIAGLCSQLDREEVLRRGFATKRAFAEHLLARLLATGSPTPS